VKSISLKKRFLNHSAVSLLLLMTLCAAMIFFNAVEEIKKNAQEQLQLHIYNILSVAEFNEQSISLPDILYNPLFNQRDSGLWAMVMDSEKKPIWYSLSIEEPNFDIDLPLQPGQWQAGKTQQLGSTYVTMSYKVQWTNEANVLNFYLVIGEQTNKHKEDIYQLTLWLALGFSSIASLLLIGQYIFLKKSFRPIEKMATEINELESGEREQLSPVYPEELVGVARNINALIKKEHQQRERYREGMANLAHSLKTPMTIISSELNAYPDNPTLKNAISNANNSIEYQLRRAVISGHTLLSKGVDINNVLSLVIEAVSKIHAEKHLSINQNISDMCVFHGDENDLMEIFGNLLDNAYKHATSKIFLSVVNTTSGISIIVEDDGPGLNTDDPSRVFKRGERLDQKGFGQGIGLAVVQDIVSSYEGKIAASRSDHGGAKFTINFTNRE